MRTLRVGSVGEDVRIWQGFLQGKGLYGGMLDGQYGPRTRQATADFQRSCGLADDGLVGNATYGAALQRGLELAQDDPPLPGAEVSLGDAWTPQAPPNGAQQVVERDPRVITDHAVGVLPCPSNPAPPVGFVYWKGPVPAHVGALAAQVEFAPAQFPMGSFVQTLVDGQLVAARVEWHDYQGATGKRGCFRGTSMFRPAV